MGTLFDLTGRVALVTGASRGLGRSIAVGLAEAGADLVITSRTISDVEAVAQGLTSTGRKVLPIQMEVTRSDDVEAGVSRVIKHFGKIDILVNNAGINIRKPVLELSEED